MIFIKKYTTDNGDLVAMCDEELLGRVLSGGKIVVDLARYVSFYKGELISEPEAKKRISAEDIFSANVVGERSVAVLVELGIVTRGSVVMLGEVPFIQVYKTA